LGFFFVAKERRNSAWSGIVVRCVVKVTSLITIAEAMATSGDTTDSWAALQMVLMLENVETGPK
jgi:hypothetical protein